MTSIEQRYNWIVDMVRQKNMWLFVSIVNDNMGQKKYGATSTLKVKDVYTQVKQLAQFVKAKGPENVCVQPVAETQTSGGIAFDNYCKNYLSNFILVYNGNKGQPKNNGGMKYRAYHPAKTSTKIPSDAFAISDHGQIIREMAYNKLDGTCNPKKVQAWWKNVKNCGCPVFGYYAFLVQKHDPNTIKTIGNL